MKERTRIFALGLLAVSMLLAACDQGTTPGAQDDVTPDGQNGLVEDNAPEAIIVPEVTVTQVTPSIEGDLTQNEVFGLTPPVTTFDGTVAEAIAAQPRLTTLNQALAANQLDTALGAPLDGVNQDGVNDPADDVQGTDDEGLIDEFFQGAEEGEDPGFDNEVGDEDTLLENDDANGVQQDDLNDPNAVIDETGQVTVFAPVNDAFNSLPADQLTGFTSAPNADVANLLRYHVVQGRVTPDELSQGNFITFDGTPFEGSFTTGGDDSLMTDDMVEENIDETLPGGAVDAEDQIGTEGGNFSDDVDQSLPGDDVDDTAGEADQDAGDVADDVENSIPGQEENPVGGFGGMMTDPAGPITINGNVQVIEIIQADNGIIYVIDRVLVPSAMIDTFSGLGAGDGVDGANGVDGTDGDANDVEGVNELDDTDVDPITQDEADIVGTDDPNIVNDSVPEEGVPVTE